jgi:phage shock protein C
MNRVSELMDRARARYYSNTQQNRLYRDRDNAVVFGVCAGLADYFGFDLKLTRICAAIGALIFFPTVVVIYLILGFVLNDSPSEPRRDRHSEDYALRRRIRSEPHATLRSIRYRYLELDRRLQRLEKHVTSRKFDLGREIDELRD